MRSHEMKPFLNRDRRPEFRLGRVLVERLDEVGSYNELARRISEAAGLKTGGRRRRQGGVRLKDIVDRRKLRKIIEADASNDLNLVLTLGELFALDRYLEQFNEGLTYKTIFGRPEILVTLAEIGDVTFVLACRPCKYRVDYSRWDVDSMGEIQDGAGRISAEVKYHIMNVPLMGSLKGAREAMSTADITELLGDDGPSIVCIGSPRANHLAEMMLARMFKVKPFQDPAPDNGGIPFCFDWSDEPSTPLKSCVATPAKGTRPKKAKENGQEWRRAFRLGDEVFQAGQVTTDQAEPMHTYGVVVSQRRRNGQFWMVVAGLSGAGTYAASMMVRSIADRLPYSPKDKKESEVQWTVVEADVRPDEDHPKLEIPRIITQRIIDGPNRWPEPQD